MWQQHSKDRAHCASGFKRPLINLILSLGTWTRSHSLGSAFNELDAFRFTWKDSLWLESSLTWKDIYLIILTYIDPRRLGSSHTVLEWFQNTQMDCAGNFPCRSRSFYCMPCAVINLGFGCFILQWELNAVNTLILGFVHTAAQKIFHWIDCGRTDHWLNPSPKTVTIRSWLWV